ncbi:MAG: peptide deformylase [Opitutaceae bacterium]|jgi:peptide deformylase|nr:peptide deformylase [Opitutaceae bacterium]
MPFGIVHYNDSRLRQKGAPVERFDDALRQLAGGMIETMRAHNGIGLAAQQVGLARQVAVIDIRPARFEGDWRLDGARPPLELFMPLTLVNPSVQILDGDDFIYEEGCLSFPDIRGDVTRPDRVRVDYRDLDGTPHTLICDDLLARCVQHEVDHLNGVLFIDRMDKKTRRALDRALKGLAAATKASAGGKTA